MVSKQTLKAYGFTKISEYYDYIWDSRINGQPQQVKQLIKMLSVRQKVGAITHLTYVHRYGNIHPLTTQILDSI